MASIGDSGPATPAGEPKYLAVKRHLRDVIATLAPGAPVPTERELAGRLEMSRTTVRQALAELVAEGRLVRRQGSGTYVAEPKLTWPLYLAGFTEQVRASGRTPSSRLLEARRVRASAALAERLGVAARTVLQRLDRLRLADNRPIAYEISWLPAARVPGLARHLRAHGSLHEILAAHYDARLTTVEETIETAPAAPREATPLQVDLGTPMLVVSRQNFDAAGTVVEYGRTWFRGDRVTLVTRLGSPLR